MLVYVLLNFLNVSMGVFLLIISVYMLPISSNCSQFDLFVQCGDEIMSTVFILYSPLPPQADTFTSKILKYPSILMEVCFYQQCLYIHFKYSQIFLNRTFLVQYLVEDVSQSFYTGSSQSSLLDDVS